MRITQGFIFTVLLTTSCHLFAADALTSQQKDFLAAEEAFQKGKIQDYSTLKNKLKHYSLYPYLEFAELSKNLSVKNRPAIDKFIKTYVNSPLAERLKARYINKLLSKKEYVVFSDYYREGKNAKQQCAYLSYQLGLPKNQAKAIQNSLLAKVDKIWNQPKSLPKNCDPLFAKWKKTGRLTHKIAYQRFFKTAQGGSLNLLNYLKRFLPRDQQYLARLWLKVRKNPSVITKPKFFPQRNPHLEAPILVHAMKNLSWGNRENAYRTWRKVKKRVALPKASTAQIERTLFLALATENNDKALAWVNRHLDRNLGDELLNHWKLATLLRNNKWSDVIALHDLLPASQRNKMQWRYWYASALFKTKNTAKAIPILQKLATERDYYGYLAATKLNLPLQLNHQDSQIPADTFSKIDLSANTERAKELFTIGHFTDASREWRMLIKKLKSPVEYQAAAKIAHKMGWFNQAIITIAKGKSWDDTNIRFPTAFKEDYLAMAKQVNLPAPWLMGVARQESAYGPFAVSPAGAYGLMQVMPATAKIYSKKFKIPYTGRKHLFEPATNINIGSRYLELRYNELKQNPVYASAAYNAGKHKIDQWKDFGRFPTEIWVESIPYTETRDYIKKVMTYRAIYALKLGLKDDAFEYITTSFTGGAP